MEAGTSAYQQFESGGPYLAVSSNQASRRATYEFRDQVDRTGGW